MIKQQPRRKGIGAGFRRGVTAVITQPESIGNRGARRHALLRSQTLIDSRVSPLKPCVNHVGDFVIDVEAPCRGNAVRDSTISCWT